MKKKGVKEGGVNLEGNEYCFWKLRERGEKKEDLVERVLDWSVFLRKVWLG